MRRTGRCGVGRSAAFIRFWKILPPFHLRNVKDMDASSQSHHCRNGEVELTCSALQKVGAGQDFNVIVILNLDRGYVEADRNVAHRFNKLALKKNNYHFDSWSHEQNYIPKDLMVFIQVFIQIYFTLEDVL